MSTKSERQFVVSEDELNDGERAIIEINGREVAVYKTNGEYHSILNWCPHQGGPIGEGQVSGSFFMSEEGEGVSDLCYDPDAEVISCPWHGWQFDVKSGDHVAEPKYKIPTFDIVVEDGKIYVEF